jgi:ribosomal protein S18 acetylase RimI-like enzyme
MNIQIRPYQPKDKGQVLDLIRQSTPEFFHPSEEADLINYLEDELEDYFVAVNGTAIIGSGGINYFPAENTARISWDMVHPHYHGKGIGRSLVAHRLKVIREKTNYRNVIVRTSQITFKFYEKLGFRLDKIEKDYWAEGFDLLVMKMELS